MLKPRKQVRMQTVKVIGVFGSFAIKANVYIGKKRVRKIDEVDLRKVARHIRTMVDDRDQEKGDYFQQRKILRDCYRLIHLEWLLSWVPGRDVLYMLRKFPRPVVSEAVRNQQSKQITELLNNWKWPDPVAPRTEALDGILDGGRLLTGGLSTPDIEVVAGSPELANLIPILSRRPGLSNFNLYQMAGAYCSVTESRRRAIAAGLNLLGVKDYQATKRNEVDFSGVENPEEKFHGATSLITIGNKPMERKETSRLASLIASFLTEFRRQSGIKRVLAYPTSGPQIYRWLAHVGTIVPALGELPKRENAIDFLTEKQWEIFSVNFNELIKEYHVSICLLDKIERDARIGAMGITLLNGEPDPLTTMYMNETQLMNPNASVRLAPEDVKEMAELYRAGFVTAIAEGVPQIEIDSLSELDKEDPKGESNA